MNRASPMVLHNSRLLIGVTMICSIISAFFAVCMVLMVFSVLSSGGGLSGGNLYNAFWWGFRRIGFRLWMPAVVDTIPRHGRL